MASLSLSFVIIIGFIAIAHVSAGKFFDKPTNFFINRTVDCQIENRDLDVSKMYVYFINYEDKTNHIHKIPIKDAARSILTKNKLDKKRNFLVFLRGFNTIVDDKKALEMKNMYSNKNIYLTIVDHSKYTNKGFLINNKYSKAFRYVKSIGKQLAQMLADLNRGGVRAEKIHAIGHSLGGQILAHTGENFHKLTGKKIARISSLDPAKPCFSDGPVEQQIRSGVAKYVEVYHCNSGVLGTDRILADVDFFVNDGNNQPECKGKINKPKCNHSRCLEVWQESVLNPKAFTAYKCDNYIDFKNNKCKKRAIAGFSNPMTAKGKYYFSTKG